MLGTRDVCSGAKEGKPSAVRKLTVPKGQGRTVMFPVVPLAAGEREIHVVAVSDSSAKDAAKVTLRVEVSHAYLNLFTPVNSTSVSLTFRLSRTHLKVLVRNHELTMK